jgi:cytochrome c-type biogenesis protein CcmH/NrfG
VPAAAPPSAARPEAAPQTSVAAPTAPPQPTAGSPRNPIQLEHLLTWGNIQMTISDYASAVNTFSELVELAPDVPAYHLRLAVAMALWPQTAKRAERAFHEALRLDPDSVDVRYQLAIYYKTMKLRARALEQLRIALSLNPQHKRAREELEILSPKDSALGSLKKLFR